MRSDAGRTLLLAAGLVAVVVAQALAQVAESASRPLRIALLPFEDRAGFQGEWNLATDVPALLGRYLSDAAPVQIIQMDTVEAAERETELEDHDYTESVARLGRYLRADIVIVGTVDRFGTRRFTVGDPNLVGYKTYSSQITLSDVRLIKVASEQEVDVFDVSSESEERPIGLDLFGRPRRQDKEFRELFTLEFASDRFFELQLGKLAAEVFGDLSTRIIRTLVEQPLIDLSGESARVLSVDGDEVFLGIGSQNHAEIGDVLAVYDAGGVQVALVEVDEVLGSQLCRARVVERAGSVEVGFDLRQRVAPMEYPSLGKEE